MHGKKPGDRLVEHLVLMDIILELIGSLMLQPIILLVIINGDVVILTKIGYSNVPQEFIINSHVI